MKPIYILSLHNVRTGGPEAIHQLSDALLEQGFDARMVYYDFDQIATIEQSPPQDGYRFGLRENTIEEYVRYKTNIVDAIPNDPDAIVVLPEVLCHLTPKFDRATVLVWWLSVDNGFGALSKVNLNYLRAPNVKHAYQSQYARRFLDALGLDCVPLSDYTTDLSALAAPIPMAERPKLVLFNANRKVIADLDAIIAQIDEMDPCVECIKITGTKSRQEMADLFCYARVYVDLGNFPGKDRGPREAAAMGCVPLIASVGAGKTDLQNYAMHSDRDAVTIVRFVNDPEQPRAVLRGSVGSERSVFFNEVGATFGLLGA